MRQSTALVLGLAIATLSIAGCAGRSACCVSTGGGGRAVLADVEPVVASPNLSALAEHDAVQLASAVTSRSVTHRGLTPIECQCLAVSASSLGKLLSSERGTVKTPHAWFHRAAHRASVERRMLYYASQEARNRSAGDALRVYWGLAEAENARPLLSASRAEAAATEAGLDELLGRGLAVPLDEPAIRVQPWQLRDRELEVELAIERLNEQLKSMLNLDAWEPDWRIWPDVELKLVIEPIDVEAAVAEGLQLRPELRMLRMLQANLDTDTLPAARRALGAINGALGSSASSCCCCLEVLTKFCSHGSACEVATRQRQLASYRADREAAVASEIRQAALAVETEAARVAVAEEQRRLRAAELAGLEEQHPGGGANLFEVRRARLELLTARAGVVSRLVAWETARVELRQAQGKLVDECRGMCIR